MAMRNAEKAIKVEEIMGDLIVEGSTEEEITAEGEIRALRFDVITAESWDTLVGIVLTGARTICSERDEEHASGQTTSC
jgi:hypothetical protein